MAGLGGASSELDPSHSGHCSSNGRLKATQAKLLTTSEVATGVNKRLCGAPSSGLAIEEAADYDQTPQSGNDWRTIQGRNLYVGSW